jgi:6-phosphofructokinase
MEAHIKHIGIFTSGGDNPGMNAAVFNLDCFEEGVSNENEITLT